MNIEAKVKRILPAETLTFQDNRTYTQQLIILDCGEYNRSTGGVLRKRHPNLFRRTQPRQVSRRHRGAKVEVHFGLKGRAYTYTDKKDNVTQREGYSLRINAYDIKVLEQSQLVQAVQQSMPQAPMQAPTAQQYAPQPQQQTPQPQPQSEDGLPF